MDRSNTPDVFRKITKALAKRNCPGIWISFGRRTGMVVVKGPRELRGMVRLAGRDRSKKVRVAELLKAYLVTGNPIIFETRGGRRGPETCIAEFGFAQANHLLMALRAVVQREFPVSDISVQPVGVAYAFTVIGTD